MKVAFASCSNTHKQEEQPIWGIIHKQRPDLLLLLGDNVYIGKEGYNPPLRTVKEQKKILKSKYEELIHEPHFRELIDKVKMLAVWDNHDFGLPGSDYLPEDPTVIRYGSEVSKDFREMTRGLFNKYIKSRSLEPDSKEVYCRRIIENIKFIMVDVRSFQTTHLLSRNIHPTLLGKNQQDWLINELLAKDAEIKVICSGIAYSEGHVNWRMYQNWNKIFRDTIFKTSKVLFLGGNIHKNRFKMHTSAEEASDIGVKKKFFYEAISSGVGRNIKSNNDENDENVENIAEDGEDPPETPAVNNYGIIDFTDELVKITLYGQNVTNIHYAEINRDNWTLKTYKCMKECTPP